MGLEAVINGGLSFAAVLILMVLNVPIGIAMLVVGFTGFAMISGFDPAIFVLGTAPLMQFQNIHYQFCLSLY